MQRNETPGPSVRETSGVVCRVVLFPQIWLRRALVGTCVILVIGCCLRVADLLVVYAQCNNNQKRADYFDWDKYFMATALVAAQRSKDPKCQVGACIVNENKRIVGVGYNGMADGCSDNVFPWGDDKATYVCHAEMNAITNKMSADIRGCVMYTTRFPCSECTKLIIQSGIKEIVYVYAKNYDETTYKASRQMLRTVGVKHRKYNPNPTKIELDYAALDVDYAEWCDIDLNMV